MKSVGLIVSVLLLGAAAFAQEKPAPKEEERNAPLELLIHDESTTVPLVEKIDDLQSQKIDLNSADIDELAAIPGISESDAKRIVEWRESRGMIRSLRSIGEMAGLSGSARQALRRFGTVDARRPMGLLSVRSRAGSDLNEGDPTLLGLTSYQRVKLRATDRIDVVAVVAKDEDERNTADFITASAAMHGDSWLRECVIGDYIAAIGCGLVSARPGLSRKSPDVTAASKKAPALFQPFGSGSEYGFYRGAAVSALFGSYQAGLFVSYKQFDASLDSLGRVTRLVTDGYHKTASELARKLNSRERSLGLSIGNASLLPGLSLRASALLLDYDRDVLIGLLPQFRTVPLVSLSGEWRTGAAFIVGEAALSRAGHSSQILSMQARLAPGVDISLLARNFARDFFSPHGSAFGENSDDLSNEQGFFAGIRWDILRELELSGYVDLFRFPSPAGRVPFPKTGAEAFVQTTYRLAPQTLMSLKLRSRNVDEMETIPDSLGRDHDVVTTSANRSARIIVVFSPSGTIDLTSSVSFVWTTNGVQESREQGTMFYEDVSWKASDVLSVRLRLIFYRTDSYVSRLYEFEPGVAGSGDAPALGGGGSRYFFAVTYGAFPWCRLSAKFGETIGDGGSRSRHGTLQADFQF